MNALPPSLDRFGDELENAVGRDLRTRRRRRYAIRGAVVLATAAAAALGLLSAFGSAGPSVVDRAAAALQPSGDSILHFKFDATQDNGDGTVATWSQETWQLRVAPYTRRQIEVVGTDGVRAESLSRGDTNELYDATTDTIYIATDQELSAVQMPKIEIVTESELAELIGTPSPYAAYFVREKGGSVKVITTEQGAKHLREHIAREQQPQTSGVLPEEFRSEVLALLDSGRVRDTGHVTVDGRDAIRLESLDGTKVLVVDAATYDPIEWTTSGDGGSVTLRFAAYEQLAVDAESLKLLDLQAQHPGAHVVYGADAYRSAESRLHPHG